MLVLPVGTPLRAPAGPGGALLCDDTQKRMARRPDRVLSRSRKTRQRKVRFHLHPHPSRGHWRGGSASPSRAHPPTHQMRKGAEREGSRQSSTEHHTYWRWQARQGHSRGLGSIVGQMGAHLKEMEVRAASRRLPRHTPALAEARRGGPRPLRPCAWRTRGARQRRTREPEASG